MAQIVIPMVIGAVVGGGMSYLGGGGTKDILKGAGIGGGFGALGGWALGPAAGTAGGAASGVAPGMVSGATTGSLVAAGSSGSVGSALTAGSLTAAIAGGQIGGAIGTPKQELPRFDPTAPPTKITPPEWSRHIASPQEIIDKRRESREARIKYGVQRAGEERAQDIGLISDVSLTPPVTDKQVQRQKNRQTLFKPPRFDTGVIGLGTNTAFA